jgi:superfamily II DNA or RNA helicase
MYSKMYFRFNAKYVLLLTATPERAADHCGGYLQWLAGPVVWYEERDISKIRWGGVDVTTYNIHYNNHPIKETLLKTGEPYWEGMVRQIIAKPERNHFVLDRILVPHHRAGRRILVLGSRIDHMEHIHFELNRRYNIPTGIIVGKHSDGHKATTQQRNDAQHMPILIATISIVCKALNIPQLDMLVVLCGGSYVNMTHWRQASGRLLRDCDDKQKPEIILIRDCYKSRVQPDSDGVFANCVDAACRTLRQMSPKGFSFQMIEVEL